MTPKSLQVRSHMIHHIKLYKVQWHMPCRTEMLYGHKVCALFGKLHAFEFVQTLWLLGASSQVQYDLSADDVCATPSSPYCHYLCLNFKIAA